MNKQSMFNIKRSMFLLYRQLCFSTNGLLIGFGAVSGVLVFILSMTLLFGHRGLDNNVYFGTIIPTFFIMGYVFTSNIFSELRTPQRGYLFLMLPASILEKLLVPWLISSVLFVLASVAMIFLINILLLVISLIFLGNPVTIFNPCALPVLKMYAIYLVTQPIFVLGSVYFRRYNFLKTVLSLFVFILILGIYVTLAGKLIINHNFQGIHFEDGVPQHLEHFFTSVFFPAVKILFWGCIAPFFLIVSYFRLKEREV